MECNAQPENGMPALRNLMILLVPQRKMLGLETLQQGQTLNNCRGVISNLHKNMVSLEKH